MFFRGCSSSCCCCCVGCPDPDPDPDTCDDADANGNDNDEVNDDDDEDDDLLWHSFIIAYRHNSSRSNSMDCSDNSPSIVVFIIFFLNLKKNTGGDGVL